MPVAGAERVGGGHEGGLGAHDVLWPGDRPPVRVGGLPSTDEGRVGRGRWHSVWHIFWHSFWHIFWHSFWPIFWHIFWHSFWQWFWHILWQSFWHIFYHFVWHYFWHILWHSFWHFFWHSFGHSFWHFFWHSFWNSLWQSVWQVFWHSFWQIFWHSFWHSSSDTLSDILLSDTFRGWGPARNTGLTGSRLRSGAEHWTHRIAVEVRRGTLAWQDRGWGPARNAELTGSRLRSGTEHWAHIIAVGDEEDRRTQRRRRGEERRGGEEQVDIKSNNPHLTGGESFGSFGDGKFSGAMLNFQGVVIHSFALQQPMLSCRVRRCLSWRAGWNWREVLEMWYMVENIKRAGPSKRLCQGSLNYPFWGIKQCKCSGRIFFVCRDSP